MKAFTAKGKVTPAPIEQEVCVGILKENKLNNVENQRKRITKYTTESKACAGVTYESSK